MKQLLFLTTCMVALNVGFGQDSVLTLQQSVETAIANNATVKQFEFQVDIAGVNVNQAKGYFVPQVNGTINHNLNSGRSINTANNSYINSSLTTANYNLTSNLTLFNGFYLLNNLKSNKYAYEASKADWQQSKDKLTLDVILAYLQMLTNTDLLEQARRQADVTAQQVSRLEVMDKEGAIKPSDLTDLRGQYANDQLAFINAQNSLDQSRYTLAQLMNVPFNKDLQVARIGADQFDMNYGSSPDSIYATATRLLAIVKAADLRTKSFEKQVKANKGNLYPSLGVGAGISTNFSSLAQDAANKKIPYDNQLRNNYGTYVGAGINIPILNNFRYRNQVKLSTINYKSAQFTAQTTKIQLKQNIEKDYFNMTAALDRYKTLSNQVDAYTQSFHAAEVRFTQGVGSTVEYLIAKNNLDRAKTNLIVARYEYLLRIKILDYYQQRPLW
ncbi:MAG TPA: TolC family protein [Chitinophagaceae bacterium]|nr:TolC family protein [Chitinophagaceae bacterium]